MPTALTGRSHRERLASHLLSYHGTYENAISPVWVKLERVLGVLFVWREEQAEIARGGQPLSVYDLINLATDAQLLEAARAFGWIS